MSQLTLRHYKNTMAFIHRDPSQSSIFDKKTITKKRYRDIESITEARHKIRSALREIMKGGL